MNLRPTNGDEKLPVEPYDPWQSRDRKGADDSPNFRPFFKGVGPRVRLQLRAVLKPRANRRL